MSKKDRLKEELGWLKLYFATFVAVDVSLIGWIAENLHTAQIPLIAAAVTAILTVTAMLVSTRRSVYDRLRQLEEV